MQPRYFILETATRKLVATATDERGARQLIHGANGSLFFQTRREYRGR